MQAAESDPTDRRTTDHTSYRPEIDGLRAIAVLAVVCFHARIEALSGGFVGVDVFFVISGYLITSIVLRDIDAGRFSYWAFWERRARRILPPLLVVTAFVLIAGWFILLPWDYGRAFESAASIGTFSSNIYFWRHSGYFEPGIESIPLLHTWSLAVEEQFYLFVPFLLVATTRIARRHRATVLLAIVVVSFAGSAYAVHARTASFCTFDCLTTGAFYLLPARAWELACGGLIACGAGWSARRLAVLQGVAVREVLSAGGLLLIGYAVIAYDATTPFPGLAAAVPVAGASLVIWSNSGSLTRTGRLLSLRPFVFVGLISYPLYLWSWPLTVFATYADADGELSGSATGAVILASVILAVISWKVVETPFRSRRWLPSRRLALATAGTGLAALLVVGTLGGHGGGYPSRLDADVLAYAAGQTDRSEKQTECFDASARLEASLDVLCSLGDTNTPPSFLLWGDSHADSLIPAFDMMATELHLSGTVATTSGCPPILDTSTDEWPHCEGYNDLVWAALQDSSVDTVILAGFWGLYEPDLHVVGSIEHDPAMTTAVERELAALTMTAERLAAAGYRVWIVEDLPAYAFDVPRALAMRELRGSDVDEAGRMTPPADPSTETLDDGLRHITSPNVHLIDLREALCDPTGCRTASDGASLYRDGDHLSTVGAAYVSPILLPMFDDIAARAPQDVTAE